MLLQSVLYDSHDPFDLFDKVEVVNSTSQLKKGACLLLHGGADISPTLYKHKVSKFCHADETPSPRDELEKEMVEQALELDMPIIGICRGAQLLCALDGGHLVQHIVGHTQHMHPVVSDAYGNLGKSNTAHHQMMVPRKTRANQTLGYVKETIYGYEQEDKLREYDYCTELVHFGEMNALGIQGHPEWMKPSDDYIRSLRRIIQDTLGIYK